MFPTKDGTCFTIAGHCFYIMQDNDSFQEYHVRGSLEATSRRAEIVQITNGVSFSSSCHTLYLPIKVADRPHINISAHKHNSNMTSFIYSLLVLLACAGRYLHLSTSLLLSSWECLWRNNT